ncbi:hypothetical protein ACFQAT_04940 [Undibacterium arcticum]|uniref:ABC transporter domain-containing protein n=1 Tax=Undibacterium arcticum TaxID=1762892 RepID=A0ABV7F7K3_9BURK
MNTVKLMVQGPTANWIRGLLLEFGLIICYPSHLSGSQQQRVAVASALAMDPN